LFIVDGSAYIYRAFFAVRHLSNAKGLPTNALHGFMQMLKKLVEQYDPEYLALTFDEFDDEAEARTFRHALYPAYKATRSDMHEDLKLQIPYFKQIVEALNIPVLIEPQVEADDVIATMTRLALERGLEVRIVSSDKDLMQLVGDHVRMIDTMRNRELGVADAIERFGVPPEKIKYVLALAGDASDNVPGVKGIGEMTGGKLIAKYGDLDGLYQNIDKLKGKQKERLIEQEHLARLSLALVTLKDDCKIELDLEALRVGPPDLDKLNNVMAELEFHTMLRTLLQWYKRRGLLPQTSSQAPAGAVSAQASLPFGVTLPDLPTATQQGVEQLSLFGVPPAATPQALQATVVTKDYTMILTAEALDAVIKTLAEQPRWAFDLETTSLDPLDAQVVGVALSWAKDQGVYIPVAHSYDGAPTQLDRAQVLAALKPLLEDTTPKKIGQHVKYEWLVLRKYDIDYRGVLFDTMLMSYVLDPGKSSHSLDALALEYLRYRTITFEDVAGKGKKQITFDKVELDAALRYAAEDADVALQLAAVMEPLLEQRGLRGLHDTLELPLTYVLGELEQVGIRIDSKNLQSQGIEFDIEIRALQDQLNAYNDGEELNANSPKQLREVLFDKLRLPIKKRTQSGPSTDQEVLEQLASMHPLPGLILEYRSLSKLKTTYIDALPALVRADTGRVHTDFNQTVAATGRLSSSNPNLQNIPVRTARGRKIREAFIPQEGWKLITADYSQIELRIMAHLSEDPTMLKAYQEGLDVHALTAARIFEVEVADVTREQRGVGKCVHPETLIMYNGRLTQIGALTFGEPDQFLAVQAETVGKGGAPIPIEFTYNGGQKQLFHIITRRGILTCTDEHALLSDEGRLVKLSDGSLAVGTKLAEPASIQYEDRSYDLIPYKPLEQVPMSWIKPSHDLAWFCGLFTGDGTKSGHAISIKHGHIDEFDAYENSYRDWQALICDVARSIGMDPSPREEIIYLGSRHVVRYFEALEVVGGVYETKKFTIPSWILNAGPTAFKHYLGGLMDADGMVRSGGLSLYSKHESFIGQLAAACHTFGLQYTIDPKWNKTYKRFYYQLRLSKADSWQLRDYIRHKGKRSRLSPTERANRWKTNEVLHIIPAGEGSCVDLHVGAEDHLYVANSFVTHNTINFGVLYGMGANRLANELKITHTQAKEYIDNYFAQFVKISQFFEELVHTAERTGEAVTMFGRRRALPEIHGKGGLRAFAERVAINSPIQGTAADIIKMAMVSLQAKIHERKLPLRMLLQVHDELVFECAPEAVAEASALIKAEMEGVCVLKAPLKVDIGVGDNWLDAK
jgi:DNA polymerase-1